MRNLLLLFFCAFALSACSWMGLDDEPPAPEPLSYAGCPKVATIRDLTIYQHPAVANEDTLVINARVGHARGRCGTVDGGLQVDGRFDLVATKGVNSAGKLANLPFFVSVVDENDTILRKDTYELPIEFENGASQLRLNTPFSVVVPVKEGEDGSRMSVLIGFYLEKEQLDANNAFFGSTTPEAPLPIYQPVATPADAPSETPLSETPPSATDAP
jgi:hypothetical protein